jgi:exopolysaccharide production protein ExoQ
LKFQALTTARDRADHFAWMVTVVCILGLIIALAGSARGALLFLASWGLLVLPRADRCLRLICRSPGLWLVPAFALLSVLWSQAPAATLRTAAELSLTIGIASLTAGFLRPREFVAAMSVGLLFAAVLSLLFGQYGVDGLSGETVFLGIFASKNTMAMVMSLLLIFAAAVLADRDQPPLLRLIAVFSFPLSIPLLVRAHSVGAFLTTGASFVVFLLIVVFARLRTRERMLLLTTVAVLVLPVAIVTLILVFNGTLGNAVSMFITGVLGKDPTLTGRTVLWHIALDQISKQPFLGIGYSAFWIQGNLLPEGIWRDFLIDSRSGFNFQDTVLEVAVELGWVGATLLVITLVLAIERTIRLAFADQSLANSALLAALFCLVTRTIGEVDAPYPFVIGTFLLFVIAAYGADYARAVSSPRRVLQPAEARRVRSGGQPQRAKPL